MYKVLFFLHNKIFSIRKLFFLITDPGQTVPGKLETALKGQG